MNKKLDQKILDSMILEYENAATRGQIYIERLARQTLLKRKSLVYYMQGMGSYFFVDKHNETVYAEDVSPKLCDFMCDWDDIFKFTGEGMCFTAKSIRCYEWTYMEKLGFKSVIDLLAKVEREGLTPEELQILHGELGRSTEEEIQYVIQHKSGEIIV